MSARRVGLVVVVVTGGALLVLAWLAVPWSPVPGGAPDPVRATSYFTQDELRAAESYASTARALSWSSLAVSLLVATALGFTRLGPALVGRLPGRWWVRAVLAVVVLAVVGRVVTLPFALGLHDHRRDAGLSTQSWPAFLRDLATGEAVAAAVTSLVVLVLLGCARRWPRAWPAVAGGVLGCLVLVGSFVYPVVVEPLFNDFKPLPDGELRSRILLLAETEGVDVDEVLVADASRRTTTLNAYVSGLGGTRRVVVYDTLVDGLPQEQALSVVAHELAHADHDDVLVGSTLGALGVASGVGALGLVLGSRRRLSPADPRVVPWLLAVVALASVATAPVQNGVSRRIEMRADVEALAVTGDPEAFVAMQRQLALRSLADPTPPGWSQAWFGSHPTVLERIAVAEKSGP